MFSKFLIQQVFLSLTMAMATMEGHHTASHVEFGEFGRRATKHSNMRDAKIVKDEVKDEV